MREFEAIDWSVYPPEIRALRGYIYTLVVGDDVDRGELIAHADDDELIAFVSAARGAGDAMESFSQLHEADMPEEVVLLAILGEASVEAELELRRRGPGS